MLEHNANPERDANVPVIPENDNPQGGADGGAPAKPQTPSEPDYKEKFGQSTRENQVLSGKLHELESRLGMVLNPEPPTESELRTAYPEWDALTDTEKRMATETVTLRKLVDKAVLIAAGVSDEVTKDKQLTAVLSKKNPDGSLKYPGLRDRLDDFNAFCQMPTHKGVSYDVLAAAFLHEIGETPTPPKPAPVPKPGLERGSGGSQPTPSNDGTLSDDEAENLRKTDPKKYNELVKKGKIK